MQNFCDGPYLAFCNRGIAWNGKNEFDKAIEDYSAAIRLNPKYTLAFNNRGNSWYGKKEYDRAIKDYNEAIRLDPNYATAFNNRGYAWSLKNDYDKAIEDCSEAIRLDPSYASAFSNRGFAWNSKKNYGKAIEDFDEAIRLDPQCISALRCRGNVWLAMKNYDKAIEDYNEVLRLDPKDAIILTNRGTAWYRKREYDPAIRDYDAAIRLDPKNSFMHFSRSLAQLLGKKRGAEDGFRTVIELQGWRNYLSPYAGILGHFAARQSGDEVTAKRFLTDIANKPVRDWPYPVVRFLLTEIDEEKLLSLAADINKRTEAHCFLGLHQDLKGRKDEALTHFRWVKEHGTVGAGTMTSVEYIIAIAELERLVKK